MNCIDLYSGIGGWTLGMKLNGIDHVRSFEWNKDSNKTHNLNFGTNTEEIDIRKLEFKDLPEVGSIDFVVGSPPCTQFSYANKGGGGNIQDGLIDMYQFLSVVEYLKPKYWAMENVPRVKAILEKVLNEDAKFKRFKKLFNYLEVVDLSEFGVPQKRKRMIAGNFPFHLFEQYKYHTNKRTLGEILDSLKEDMVVDPIYGYSISKGELTDHIIEDYLNHEELRLNRESKEYHPIYNGMSFPEKLDKPARTITSTCTRVSRESLVIQDGSNYRRLTVRERGMIMGFPITYQYYGGTFNSKLKMIGNAIPPIATYYLFQSMLEVPVNDLVLIEDSQNYRHDSPESEIPNTPPDKVKFKYRESRSFRLAVPNYRFGSGVRFELSNNCLNNNCAWGIKFFYGSSKKIHQTDFTRAKVDKLLSLFESQNLNVNDKIDEIITFSKPLSSQKLQMRWIHKSLDEIHPYDVLDKLSTLGLNLRDSIINLNISDSEFNSIIGDSLNAKLYDNKILIISGIILGYYFNENIDK